MNKLIIIFVIFIAGCATAPREYHTSIYDGKTGDKLLYVEQQGRGIITYEHPGHGKITTDYKTPSLMEDIIKLYALKKINEDD